MTNKSAENVRNFTELTCTNMMLKLKILTKRMKKNDPLEFYATREQFDNIKKPFSKGKLDFSGSKVGDNQYRCTIVKVK